MLHSQEMQVQSRHEVGRNERSYEKESEKQTALYEPIGEIRVSFTPTKKKPLKEVTGVDIPWGFDAEDVGY